MVRKSLILCQPRTGSNYLGSLLGDHPDVGFEGEYFTHHEERAWGYVRFDPGYRSRGKSGARVVVAKFFYNLVPLLERFGGPVVHLIRENPFDRHLSFRLAETHCDPALGLGSGPRHQWGWSHAIYKEPVEMNPVRVHRIMDEYVEKITVVDKCIADWGGEFLRVSYENLVSFPGDDLHRQLCDLLGVSHRKLVANAYFRKQRQGPQSQFVVNYDELVKYFSVTPYAWCFTG